MTKKRKQEYDQQPPEQEPVQEQVELTETAPGEVEAGSSASQEPEVSMDDLLDDVRRSLIEADESGESDKGWLGKLSKSRRKGKKKAEPAEEKPPVVEPVKAKLEAEPESEYLEQIDQLIDMLEPVETAAVSEPEVEATLEPVTPEPELEPEPEPVDLTELKKRVFSLSKEEKPEEDFSQVRSVALDGGEEVFVEVEARKEDAVQERVKAFENSLRPYRGTLYFLLAFLGIVLAVAAGTVMYRAYQIQNPRPPTPTPVESDLPFPTQVILPGGLSFNLGKGQIVEGAWNPQGPEWLRGTEVCRWVAIPWSRPLEAAVRTLTRQDSIELVMSNNDRLTYDVVSIQSLTLEEMQKLDQNSPCLLVVLAEQDAEKRWVVSAKP